MELNINFDELITWLNTTVADIWHWTQQNWGMALIILVGIVIAGVIVSKIGDLF